MHFPIYICAFSPSTYVHSPHLRYWVLPIYIYAFPSPKYAGFPRVYICLPLFAICVLNIGVQHNKEMCFYCVYSYHSSSVERTFRECVFSTFCSNHSGSPARPQRHYQSSVNYFQTNRWGGVPILIIWMVLWVVGRRGGGITEIFCMGAGINISEKASGPVIWW